MGTPAPEQPNDGTRTLKVQRTIFDLDAFDSKLLGKEIKFAPAATFEAALSAVGNDQAKLLDLINKGLELQVRDAAYYNNEGWRAFDEDGDLKDAFTGTITEPKNVNQTVATLAKTIFGYNKDMKPEQKKAAKDAAMKMVRETEGIREGLKRRAMQKEEE